MYRLHISCLTALAGILGLVPGTTVGGVAFPDSGVYSQSFDGPLGAEWTLDRWTTATVPASGAAQAGTISGTPPAGVTTPLPAIVAPGSFSSYGFSGKWLTNLARGNALGGPPPRPTARLEFTNLPWHDRIDLDLLLAVGDTIDGTDTDGPLTIKIDGSTVFQFRFNSGGANLAPADGIVRLTRAGGENLTNWYWERWKPNAVLSSDRTAEGWTLDSAYNMNDYTGFSLPHTSSTLTIELIHELSSDHTDEYFAIDNLTMTMNIVPEPSAGLLALAGAAIVIVWRRP